LAGSEQLLGMSVSLILEYAVKRFLRKLLKKSTDNYQIGTYIVVKEVIDSLMVLKFMRGCPPSMGKVINY